MKILLIDKADELKKTEATLKKTNPNAAIFTADNLKDAEEFVKKNHFDVLISECELNEKSIFPFLWKTKETNPHINILIVSDLMEYKPEALDLKVSAYLNKPLVKEELKKEMKELRYPVNEKGALLRVQCFGSFSVFDTNGNLLHFTRSKSKELLAFLVYKHGSSVTTRQLAAVLFEGDFYDSRQQTYLQQLFHSLFKDLKSVGAEDVLVRNYNSTSIDVSLIDCDYYRFSNNEAIAKRLYNGEFMVQYEWADYVAAYLDRRM